MTVFRKPLLLMAIATVMSGCQAYSPPPPSPYSFKVFTNQKPVGWDTTTTYIDAERGGAAYREAAYEQVLGFRSFDMAATDSNTLASGEDVLANPTQAALASARDGHEEKHSATHAKENDAPRSYSVYELSRWERYCGAGKMDERDWAFVTKEGAENIPLHLLVDCKAKQYSEADYRAAWKNACGGNNSLSATDRQIIQNSIRPKNACKG